ncbi:hypothetical protein RIF29_34396 [Crotalaria pallida]|uniref:Protein Iojap-related, mitochondrial n=1 Tax=Crotalaria pallida TaxID=3830 RepID=A0AAN9HTI4_CROPI
MWPVLRSRTCSLSSSSSQPSLLLPLWKRTFSSSSVIDGVNKNSVLELQEIEKVLTDVKADDVKVIPVPKHCDWADFMVLATGRSTWHVKNIAQALIYKAGNYATRGAEAKQKQKGAERMMLPSVEGQAGGKWIVVDSGRVIIHALEEKARAYYNLENLWTPETMQKDLTEEDLQKALVKVRRINNSKKRIEKNA